MVRVFDPLPDITLHVVKPERVRWKLSHRSRVVPLVASFDLGKATPVRAVVGLFVARLVAPGIEWVGGISAGDAARCVFPFRLGQQSIRFACHP